MIVKQFEFPIDVNQLGALKERTLNSLPQHSIIARDFYQCLAGLNGEKEVYFQLQFLPTDEYLILHNVRISDGKNYPQFDFIILNRNFFLNLEVKNYKGEVYFNEIEQIVHVKEDGSEPIYDNPLSQSERHVFQFQNWLYSNGLFDLPVISLVVFSSSTRLLRMDSLPKTVLNQLVPSSNIVKRIMELSKSFSTPVLNKQELFSLSQKLLKANIPIRRNLFQKYNINKTSISKGVQCPNCKSLPMKRIYGKWECQNCGHANLNAHIQALNDYYLLINEYITNHELRDFLLIDSPTVAYKLMRNAGYKREGKGPSSKYLLEFRKL